jgi:hypothetical protein
MAAPIFCPLVRQYQDRDRDKERLYQYIQEHRQRLSGITSWTREAGGPIQPMCEFGHCRPFFRVKQRHVCKPRNISGFQHDDWPIDTQYPSFSHPFFTGDRLPTSRRDCSLEKVGPTVVTFAQRIRQHSFGLRLHNSG